ncbi:hypothetical protein ACLB2K_020043 [Fragaria x ananassa]
MRTAAADKKRLKRWTSKTSTSKQWAALPPPTVKYSSPLSANHTISTLMNKLVLLVQVRSSLMPSMRGRLWDWFRLCQMTCIQTSMWRSSLLRPINAELNVLSSRLREYTVVRNSCIPPWH